MPACQGPQATVPDADVDSATSLLGYRYIVSQYTVRLMTLCVWRILCIHNSSSVPYFRQPPNLPTAACRNRKCTECGTTAFGRNRMSAESVHLSTFGAETETEAKIRSTSRGLYYYYAYLYLLIYLLILQVPPPPTNVLANCRPNIYSLAVPWPSLPLRNLAPPLVHLHVTDGSGDSKQVLCM